MTTAARTDRWRSARPTSSSPRRCARAGASRRDGGVTVALDLELHRRAPPRGTRARAGPPGAGRAQGRRTSTSATGSTWAWRPAGSTGRGARRAPRRDRRRDARRVRQRRSAPGRLPAGGRDRRRAGGDHRAHGACRTVGVEPDRLGGPLSPRPRTARAASRRPRSRRVGSPRRERPTAAGCGSWPRGTGSSAARGRGLGLGRRRRSARAWVGRVPLAAGRPRPRRFDRRGRRLGCAAAAGGRGRRGGAGLRRRRRGRPGRRGPRRPWPSTSPSPHDPGRVRRGSAGTPSRGRGTR